MIRPTMTDLDLKPTVMTVAAIGIGGHGESVYLRSIERVFAKESTVPEPLPRPTVRSGEGALLSA